MIFFTIALNRGYPILSKKDNSLQHSKKKKKNDVAHSCFIAVKAKLYESDCLVFLIFI